MSCDQLIKRLRNFVADATQVKLLRYQLLWLVKFMGQRYCKTCKKFSLFEYLPFIFQVLKHQGCWKLKLFKHFVLHLKIRKKKKENYYEVWQKYYKVRQVLQSVTKSYYEVCQALQKMTKIITKSVIYYKVWQLPVELKQSESLDSFKLKIKNWAPFKFQCRLCKT